jgi:hypothetical protein
VGQIILAECTGHFLEPPQSLLLPGASNPSRKGRTSDGIAFNSVRKLFNICERLNRMTLLRTDLPSSRTPNLPQHSPPYTILGLYLPTSVSTFIGVALSSSINLSRSFFHISAEYLALRSAISAAKIRSSSSFNRTCLIALTMSKITPSTFSRPTAAQHSA